MKRGITVYELHGDIPANFRMNVVRQWMNADSRNQPGALLCMIQVAGVGLTLTAASKCIFVDKLFSPKLNEQAEDRLHRISADVTKPVQIYSLICRNSIESRVEQILRQKQKVFGTIVDTDTSEWKRALIAAVLSREEDVA